jgi:hypothetical protein
MEIIQIIIIVFAIFALSRAFLRFKENRLTTRDFVFWIIIWFAIIVLSFLPNIAGYISMFFGIGRGIDLAVYVSIVALFYLVFRVYVKAENLEKEITELVRKIAHDKEEKIRRKK